MSPSISTGSGLSQRLRTLVTVTHEDFPSAQAAEVIVLGADQAGRMIHPPGETVPESRRASIIARAGEPAGAELDVVWASITVDERPVLMLVLWACRSFSVRYRTTALAHLVRAAGELEAWIAARSSRLKWASARVLDVQAARVAERRRLAYDLHATVAQELAAARLYRHALPMAGPGESEQVIAEISGHVETAFGQMRSLLDDLHAQPDGRPLTDALAALVAEYERKTNASSPGEVRFEIAASGLDEPVSEQACAAVLYVTREALQNVYEHARADHVTVIASVSEQTLTVRVEDNGIGFDRAQFDPSRRHLGLEGMREQARVSDGEFEVKPRAGGGTAVTFQVPCSQRP